MPDFDTAFYIVVAGSFFAALCNAAFSVGGALIILAVTSTVLPVGAIVPIHSTLLFGSTTTRMLLFRHHVDWRLTGSFLAGSVPGAALGARIYVDLPETVVATAIGVMMMIAIWLPRVRWRPKLRHPWTIVGFVHTLLSTLFAYGALFQSVILHTQLDRRQIVGTMAGCLTGMGFLKIAAYVWAGFDYTPYLHMIVFALAAAIFGTWIGKFVIDRISEKLFRAAFRVLVTITALRLLAVAWLH